MNPLEAKQRDNNSHCPMEIKLCLDEGSNPSLRSASAVKVLRKQYV